jgi:hypothetical protein
MKSKHQINKLSNQINNPPPAMDAATYRHSPPTSGDGRRHPPPPTFGDFSSEKKKRKKKIDLAIEGGCDPPQRPGGEIRPPRWPFLSLRRTKKKSDKPKKLFLMPQKSILMP